MSSRLTSPALSDLRRSHLRPYPLALLLGLVCIGGLVSADPIPNLNGIDTLRFAGHGTMTLIQSGEPRLDVVSDERDEIEMRRDGNTLVIRVPDRVDDSPEFTLVGVTLQQVRASGAIAFNADALTVPTLTVRTSGSAKIRINNLQTDHFKFEGSGSSEVQLGGSAAQQTVSISGAGQYDAMELRSDTAELSTSGAAKVRIRAESDLNVRSSGASKVEYAGAARLRQHGSGSSSIQHVGG